MTASEIARNASEALLLFATIGAFAATLRWRRAPRLDFLGAVIVFLLGTAAVQLPVYIGGMTGWGPDLVLLSGLARWVSVLGCILYVRAALKDYCGPWGWRTVTGAVLLITVML